MQPNSHAEYITAHERVYAVVIRAEKLKDFGRSSEKYCFPTPPEFSLQMGIQNRDPGELAPAHAHRPLTDIAHLPVQEFLYVLFGKAKVELFDVDQLAKVGEVVIAAGDSIMMNAGHAVTFLKKTQLLNIKQGPYRGRDEEKIFIQQE